MGDHVNVNVNNLLAISESDFDNSGPPGPQALGALEAVCKELQQGDLFRASSRSTHVHSSVTSACSTQACM